VGKLCCIKSGFDELETPGDDVDLRIEENKIK
jgi:hypothetical protein